MTWKKLHDLLFATNFELKSKKKLMMMKAKYFIFIQHEDFF